MVAVWLWQVPDGYRMVVSAGPNGVLRRALYPLVRRRPTWEWRYEMGPKGAIRLSIVEGRPARPGGQPVTSLADEHPFSYVI